MKSLAIGLVFVLVFVSVTGYATAGEKPNIVFVMADEPSFDN